MISARQISEISDYPVIRYLLAQLRTIQILAIRVKANNSPIATISVLYNSPGPGANMLKKYSQMKNPIRIQGSAIRSPLRIGPRLLQGIL